MKQLYPIYVWHNAYIYSNNYSTSIQLKTNLQIIKKVNKSFCSKLQYIVSSMEFVSGEGNVIEK